jgi:hypothetical protein
MSWPGPGRMCGSWLDRTSRDRKPSFGGAGTTARPAPGPLRDNRGSSGRIADNDLRAARGGIPCSGQGRNHSTWPDQPIRRYAHGPPDAVPDKTLSHGERIPAGPPHHGLLDAPQISIGRGEGVPEVEVEVVRLVLLGHAGDPAALDVRRGLRDAEHHPRVSTGLLRQLALRRAGQRDIGRLEVTARSRSVPSTAGEMPGREAEGDLERALQRRRLALPLLGQSLALGLSQADKQGPALLLACFP